MIDDFELRAILAPVVDGYRFSNLRLGEYLRAENDDGFPDAASSMLLLHLGAAWSPATVELAQKLSALRDRLHVRPVSVLLLLVDGERQGQRSDTSNIVHFARRHNITIPIAMDPAHQVQPEALPLSLLIDRRSMRIISTESGLLEGNAPLWRNLQELIGGPIQPGDHGL